MDEVEMDLEGKDVQASPYSKGHHPEQMQKDMLFPYYIVPPE
jgi:hypothetical protein